MGVPEDYSFIGDNNRIDADFGVVNLLSDIQLGLFIGSQNLLDVIGDGAAQALDLGVLPGPIYVV